MFFEGKYTSHSIESCHRGGKTPNTITEIYRNLRKCHLITMHESSMSSSLKVPINPKIIFGLNKSLYNSEQNGAKMFVFGRNQNFL